MAFKFTLATLADHLVTTSPLANCFPVSND